MRGGGLLLLLLLLRVCVCIELRRCMVMKVDKVVEVVEVVEGGECAVGVWCPKRVFPFRCCCFDPAAKTGRARPRWPRSAARRPPPAARTARHAQMGADPPDRPTEPTARKSGRG